MFQKAHPRWLERLLGCDIGQAYHMIYMTHQIMRCCTCEGWHVTVCTDLQRHGIGEGACTGGCRVRRLPSLRSRQWMPQMFQTSSRFDVGQPICPPIVIFRGTTGHDCLVSIPSKPAKLRMIPTDRIGFSGTFVQFICILWNAYRNRFKKFMQVLNMFVEITMQNH